MSTLNKPDYNSQREHLQIAEYGRNIQIMAQHAVSLPDKEERTKAAKTIIGIMEQLFPESKAVEDYHHKLWDHLHIISEYKLDVDSPYPKPEREHIMAKPEKVNYPNGNIKWDHYGTNTQNIIKGLLLEPESEERKKKVIKLANLMKRQYLTWNRDSVDDELIIKQLGILSDGSLTVEDPENQLTSTRDIMYQDKRKKTRNAKFKSKKSGGTNNKNSFRKRKY